MGITKAFTSSVGGVLADQWRDIITAGSFDEHTVVVPGCLKSTNNGRGSNTNRKYLFLKIPPRLFSANQELKLL